MMPYSQKTEAPSSHPSRRAGWAQWGFLSHFYPTVSPSSKHRAQTGGETQADSEAEDVVPPDRSMAMLLSAKYPSGVAAGLLRMITAKFLHVSYCHHVYFIPTLLLLLFWSESQN